MRHFVVALLAATTLGVGAAAAADIPVRTAPAPMYSPAPVFSWTGFYAGVNVGYGWANVGDAGGTSTSNLSGFIGGGQIGYNWQTGPLVLGLEGDFQGSAQRRSDTVTALGIAFTVNQKISSFGTVRGRIGYAFDRFLVYATGGWAYLNYKMDVSALGTTVNSSASSNAWTAGGGVEWMMWDRWSTKLEYLYIDTGSTSVTLFGVPFNARAKDNIVRVGLNYHF